LNAFPEYVFNGLINFYYSSFGKFVTPGSTFIISFGKYFYW